MLSGSPAFAGFSVNDIEAARTFYEDVLGLEVTLNQMGILDLRFLRDGHVIVYPKNDHVPATYTVLNFPVDDIDVAVDGLAARGVVFQRYDGMPQDDKGVLRGKQEEMGPNIAWFTDPAGNVFSVMEN